MEINWSTFVLEIINFLVLVWILKRFLYRPVLSVIEQRNKSIEESLNEATNRNTQAIELEQKYKQRLKDWEREKQKIKEKLQNEILTERTQRLEKLKKELESEREKSAVVEQRKLAESLRQYQHNAHEQGARFATRLLTAVADKELEARLFNLFINTIDILNEEQQMTLVATCKSSDESIVVKSAYTLSKSQHEKLNSKLNEICKQSVNINYEQDSNLIAGLRIRIGASVLSLNLQDELKGYADLIHENK